MSALSLLSFRVGGSGNGRARARHWSGEHTSGLPGRRGARVDRLDRHPGARGRPRRTRTGSGSSGSRPAAATSSCSPRQALELGVEVVAVRQGERGAGPPARVLRRGQAPAGTTPGEYPVPKILAGPDAATELAALARATSCSTASPARSGSARRWPRCDAGPHPRAGQQGVADRRRPAGQGRRARPGQIVPVDSRALGARPVPARRAAPTRSRRLVLTASGGPFRGRTPRRAAPTSPPSRRWRTRPGTWARSSRSTRPPW